MGLLDDAIREHLDLKRKHGAGEDELRRQESEALGPARRDFSGDSDRTAEPEAARRSLWDGSTTSRAGRRSTPPPK
jgi:hypothetical protein